MWVHSTRVCVCVCVCVCAVCVYCMCVCTCYGCGVSQVISSSPSLSSPSLPEDSEVYVLYLTGSCLTSLRETGVDSGDDAAIHFKVNRKGSFIHLVDHQALPDQGNDPILLKNNLSLKMQGITTSRILLLQ